MKKLVVIISMMYLLCVTFSVEAEQRTEMEKIPDTHTWNPQYQDYFVRSGIWIQMINVEYEHLCSHAVDRRSSRSGAYDRISVSFDSRRIK